MPFKYIFFPSSKPTVKLLYNRSNNKYSYTRWVLFNWHQAGSFFLFFFFCYLWREEVVLIILPFHTAILTTTCWKTLSSLTSCPCGLTAGCSSSKMWSAMRSVVGPSMAKAVRLLKCAVHLLFMPQKRSRQRYIDHITWCSTCYFRRRWQTPDAWRSPSFARWSSQKPEFMRRLSTSYCMNPTMAEVQTTPCWRLPGAQRVDLII